MMGQIVLVSSEVDLSGYLTIDDLSDYALMTQIPDTLAVLSEAGWGNASDYVRETELTDLLNGQQVVRYGDDVRFFVDRAGAEDLQLEVCINCGSDASTVTDQTGALYNFYFPYFRPRSSVVDVTQLTLQHGD